MRAWEGLADSVPGSRLFARDFFRRAVAWFRVADFAGCAPQVLRKVGSLGTPVWPSPQAADALAGKDVVVSALESYLERSGCNFNSLMLRVSAPIPLLVPPPLDLRTCSWLLLLLLFRALLLLLLLLFGGRLISSILRPF